ncbi:MAG: exopolysaccharide export protein VpsN [Aliiglaciecola sp.]|uniref:polysaccharide biosynthesis/export family protein n=1 Tax=Aliiglaciecola sp. M165 TaxID=2593649 RepID=UPI00117D090D|nr:polysaccharide biosynthesis/export family protein [Aliiglaciecola sp. M165]TRY32850.1 polysaccharide export protein [Aliiglaciecola sp. M165]
MINRVVLLIWLGLSCFGLSAQELDESQYRLGSGDVIKISVFGEDDLSIETRLSQTGKINYPFLGDIQVVSLTVSELETFIYDGLKGDYLISPSVSVSVVEYRPFFIDGEVKKPGGYPYQPGLSIDKAAALAGGYTERASKSKITVVREVGEERVTIAGKSTDTVRPGDIITIQQSFF